MTISFTKIGTVIGRILHHGYIVAALWIAYGFSYNVVAFLDAFYRVEYAQAQALVMALGHGAN